METPSKEDKKFLNSWNDDEGSLNGMPPESDFLGSSNLDLEPEPNPKLDPKRNFNPNPNLDYKP